MNDIYTGLIPLKFKFNFVKVATRSSMSVESSSIHDD